MRLRVPEGKEYQVHGRTVRTGDEFDAPDKEGALWKATGLAVEIPTEKQMTPSLPFKRGPGRPSKAELAARYERKDMRAEDD